MICTSQQILFRCSNREECDQQGMRHTGVWWEDAREDHLEDLGVDERIILKWIFKKRDGEA